MKKFDIPPVLAYIILLSCIAIIAFGVPRLGFILGSIYHYGLYALFAFVAVVIVLHAILDGKE